MKAVAPIAVALGGLVAVAFLHHRRDRAASERPVLHIRNQFEFTVHAPYRVAAPLFGPEGERLWTARWDPHFLYPQPARDIQGAVFTIRHGRRHAYWINTCFDMEARHFQYVYLMPDTMIVLIDVRFSELDAENTKVDVAYERTALNPEANERVKELGNSDREGAREWGETINQYLAGARPVGQ